MKSMDLYSALSEADGRFVDEAREAAESTARNKRPRRLGLASLIAAACLLLAGCTVVAAGIATGWNFRNIGKVGSKELTEEYGIIEEIATDYEDKELVEVSVVTCAYELTADFGRALNENLSGCSEWDMGKLTLAELEDLSGIHILSIPGGDRYDPFSFAAFRDDEGGRCIAAQFSDGGFGWSVIETAVLSAEGGEIAELRGVIPQEDMKYRRTAQIAAVDAEAVMYFKHGEVPLYDEEGKPIGTMPHNAVVAWFVSGDIAYNLTFSLDFGSELSPEAALERATELISAMR